MIAGHALLVEDSEIIALDTEDMLLEIGFETVAIARNYSEASAELGKKRPVVAILDVNLDTETSIPIAVDLNGKGIPFIFATGYGAHASFPPALASSPIISKPYTLDSLRNAVAAVLEAAKAT
jgi:DNA-binding NtrC family response regulator